VPDYLWLAETPDGASFRVALGPPGSGLDVDESDAWSSTPIRSFLDRAIPFDLIAAAFRAIRTVTRATGPRWRVTVSSQVPRVSFWRPRTHQELFSNEDDARRRVDEVLAAIAGGRWATH
jgi:hypothetical protein